MLFAAVAYFLCSKLGLALTLNHTFTAPLWPASGVGLAMAILWGWRIWPGIALGALAFSLAEGQRSFGLTLSLTVAHTLEAVIPALILSRLDFHPTIDRVRDFVTLTIAANLGAAICALLGVVSFAGHDFVHWAAMNNLFLTWFMGNTLGALIVGCLLLTWSQTSPSKWTFESVLEGIGILLVTLLIIRLTFFQNQMSDIWMPYWTFPVLIWAAVRFGPPGSTAVTALISGMAIWVTLTGSGPFGNGSKIGNVLALQTYLGLTAATTLILSSVARGREQAQQALRDREASLTTAQLIAHFGSWEVDLAQSRQNGSPFLSWSDECYRIFGLPSGAQVTQDLFFSRVHPDDREKTARALAKAITNGEEFGFTHRILLPGGETRYVSEQARIFRDPRTGRPARMVGTAHDITESQRAEAQMLESEERYRLLADNATDTISRHNSLGVFLYVSPACHHLLGYEPEELIGRDLYSFLHPDDVVTVRHSNLELLKHRETKSITYRLRRRNDSYVWVEATARSLCDSNTGEINELICITRDITERRNLESQLQQAQKMDAIGQLAGGVAHDFNNLLTVISGYVGLATTMLPDDHPVREFIGEIRKAADKATGLTRQLLAFSRRAMLEPKVLDLNALVTENEKMIRRLIGEDVEFSTKLAADLGQVKVDRAQMDQVILNLVVNARDAMPQGGKLTIETSNVTLADEYRHDQPEVSPGPYVLLSVTDTGTGMSPETLHRVFEPFFTTKGLGKGTGLGLATVYGIIKQSGGQIVAHSELGAGSSFKIYLPHVTEAPPVEKQAAPVTRKLVPGRGTVLLVEDEESVRLFAERILFDAGYQVLTASNGEEALRIADIFLNRIDLILTDVVMPRMSGRVMAETLRQRKPALKVLYMSGYTDDAMLRHGVMSAESAFIQKPFSAVALSEKIHLVLTA